MTLAELSVALPVRNGSTDDTLVTEAIRGNPAAFRSLYQQHARAVYNFVLRSVRDPQLAEDVSQEIWIKAHRELARLREPDAFTGWLYRIAARACIDAARKRGRTPAAIDVHDNLPSSRRADPERSAIQKEEALLAWETLGTLPARQHLALFLREIEGLSYRAIAEALQTSESAVETLLFRARRAFAKNYESLEASTGQRCLHARKAMAVVIDGEATQVHKRALRAHAEACQACRSELDRIQQASKAYSSLPLLPAPVLIQQRLFEAIGILTTSSSGGVATFVALATAKAKLLTATLMIAGSITAGSVILSGEVAVRGPSNPAEPTATTPPRSTASLRLPDVLPVSAMADTPIEPAVSSPQLPVTFAIPASGIFEEYHADQPTNDATNAGDVVAAAPAIPRQATAKADSTIVTTETTTVMEDTETTATTDQILVAGDLGASAGEDVPDGRNIDIQVNDALAVQGNVESDNSGGIHSSFTVGIAEVATSDTDVEVKLNGPFTADASMTFALGNTSGRERVVSFVLGAQSKTDGVTTAQASVKADLIVAPSVEQLSIAAKIPSAITDYGWTEQANVDVNFVVSIPGLDDVQDIATAQIRSLIAPD